MEKLKIKQVKNIEEYSQVLTIRKQVFIDEQKVPENIEIDEYEEESTHFIAFLKNIPIGCARIRFIDRAKLERIAIIKKHRRNGYGKTLTKYLINFCVRKKYNEIYLHSQSYILDFYKKLGFKPVGKKFFEADIEHVEMNMTIP